jgi:hypothetical protein
MGGPFAGMRYIRTEYSQLGPKILGTYERELEDGIPWRAARRTMRSAPVLAGPLQ